MPTATKQREAPPQTFREYLRSPLGMVATTASTNISSDRLLQFASNMTIVGALPDATSGGVLKSRLGKWGELTAVQAGDVVDCCEFRKPTGEYCLMEAVCTSPGASTATLRIWDRAGHTTVAVDDSVHFNSFPNGIDNGIPAVKIVPYGMFLYIIGATDGITRRMPLDGSGLESAQGLLTPTGRATVTATNFSIGSAIASAWAADDLSAAANDITNGDFSASGSPTTQPGWTFTGGAEADHVAGGMRFLRMDSPTANALTAQVANNLIANANDTTTPGGAAPRYATKFDVGFTFNTGAAGISDGINFTILLYDASHTPIPGGSQTYQFVPGITGSYVQCRHIFSFVGLDPTTPVYYALNLSAGTVASPSGNPGPYATNIYAKPYAESTTFSDAAGSGGTVNVNFTPLTGLSPATQSNTVFWGDQHYSFDTGASYDLTAITRLDLPFNPLFVVDGYAFVFGLKSSASALPFITPPGTAMVTTGGQSYLSVDLSGVDRSTLTAITIIEVIWQQDSTATVNGSNNGSPIQLRAFANSGGLNANRQYTVFYQENEHGDDPALMIESGLSPGSVAVTTDALNAVLTIILPAPLNSVPPVDSFTIGVAGGTDTTGFVYKEYNVPVGTPGTWPGLTIHFGPTTYYTSVDGTDALGNTISYATWYPGTRTLITQMPDSYRQSQPILYQHNPGPLNAQAIDVYQNRLTLASGSKVYISRDPIAANNISGGLYFNEFTDVADPDFSISGLTDQVGYFAGVVVGGQIIAIAPFNGRLYIFFANVMYIVSGVNNDDFAIRQYHGAVEIGIAARNAITVTPLGLTLLATNGVYVFDGVNLSRSIGNDIALLLNPSAEQGGASLNTVAYARSSMIYHDDRLLLSVPNASSGAVIAQTFVMDARTSRWTGVWYLGAIYCGASFTGSGSDDALILGDGAGMLSSMKGGNYGDKATSGATATAVPCTLLTRQVEDPSGQNNDIAATRFSFSVQSSSDFSVFFDVQGNNGQSGSTWGEQQFDLLGDATFQAPQPGPIDVQEAQGATLQMTYRWNTIAPVTLEWIRMEYSATKSR